MLKVLGGMGDMAKMMRSAEELQNKLTDMQDELGNLTVVGESGGGLVKATATAKGELKSLDIDPLIFNGDDKEVAEDLILAAVKDAQNKASELSQKEMARVTGSMKSPF